MPLEKQEKQRYDWLNPTLVSMSSLIYIPSVIHDSVMQNGVISSVINILFSSVSEVIVSAFLISLESGVNVVVLSL